MDWPFLKGDLYHWIPALNRFDDILEQFVGIYSLNRGPQTEPFTRKYLLQGDKPEHGTSHDVLDGHEIPEDGDWVLIKQVIIFIRVLLEHCGNRSLFSSSSHLSNILNTSSLSLLSHTLRLGLRLAQRYADARLRSGATSLPAINQALLASHYQIDLGKLESIAQPFVKSLEASRQQPGKVKETDKGISIIPSYGSDLLALVLEQGPRDNLLQEYGHPWLTYEDDEPTPPGKERPGSSAAQPHSQRENGSSLAEPVSPRVSSDAGATTDQKFGLVDIPAEKLAGTPVYAIAREYLPLVPAASRYELFSRIRNASALVESVHSRQELVGVRMLALGNLAHIQPEHSLQHGVLQYEGDEPRRSQLPYQLCNLVHPPGHAPSRVPKYLQAIALATLHALINHRTKVNEVSAALGISVNHGALTYASRRALKELEDPNQDANSVDLEDLDWRENLLALLHMLPKLNHRAGEGFVSAGIVDTFVASLKIHTPTAEHTHSSTLTFLDVFIYNTRPAFTALVNAGGLDIVSELVAYEVETAMVSASDGDGMPTEHKTPTIDYQIKYHQQRTLHQIFKIIKNWMTLNAGAFDRLLRNLIESSQLLTGLKTVIMNPKTFGSNIWSGAVEIFTSFIHNEPTSYAAIAEAGLTKAFLDQVTSFAISLQKNGRSEEEEDDELKHLEESACVRILPNAEAIAVIPNAFDAICLTEAGTRQFEQSGALDLFFIMITMAPYVQALANATDSELESLGAGFDELVRHHPRLKRSIVRGLFELTETYGQVICANDNLSVGAKLCVRDSHNSPVPDKSLRMADKHNHWGLCESTTLAQTSSEDAGKRSETNGLNSTGSEDVNMGDDSSERREAQSRISKAKSRILRAATNGSTPGSSIGTAERVRILAIIHLGFFHYPSHVASFAETGALEWMVEIATSLSLPHDLAHKPGFDKLTKLLHLLIEHKAHLVVPLLINRAQHALQYLKPFLEQPVESSFFSSFFVTNANYASGCKEDSSLGNGTWSIKMLLVIQNICRILARGFAGSSHRNSTAPFSTMNLTDLYLDLVDSLGKLQIRCVWESMLALQMIPSDWIKPKEPHQIQSPSSHSNALDVAEDGLASSRPATNAESTQAAVLAATSPSGIPNGAADQAQHPTSMSWKSESSDTVEKQNFLTLRVVLHHVPIEIAGFYATIGKALLPRRMPNDPYGKQNTVLVAEHIARTLVSLLNYPNPSTLKPRVTNYFRMVSLSLVTQAQMDKKVELVDRAGPQILTLIAQQFYRSGGIEAIGATMQKLFEDNLTDMPDDHQDSKSHGVHFAVQALQLALKFLMQVTNQKSVSEAHQTNAMTSRTLSGERDKLEHFSTAQFLVDLRYQALRALLPLWNSDSIRKGRPSVVKSICGIVQNVLDASGESGALQKKDKPLRKPKVERKQWTIRNAERWVQLRDRGFDQEVAREALYRCNENMVTATEYCEARKRHPSLPSFPIPPNDDTSMLMEHSAGKSAGEPQAASSPGPPEVSLPSEAHAVDDDLLSQILHEPGNAPLSSESREPGLAPAAHQGTLPMEISPNGSSSLPSVPPENGTSSSTEPPTTQVDERTIFTIEELDGIRDGVRRDLVERCLTILDGFDDLSFELADLITSGTGKSSEPSAMRQDVSITLIQSLISIKESGSLEQGSKRIIAIAHLLGIILQDKDFFDSARGYLEENFSGLVEFLAISPDDSAGKLVGWIGPILLILERVLSEDAQPHQIIWSPPSSENPKADESPASFPTTLISYDQKEAFFNTVLDMLPRTGKNAALGLAVMRILVSLTRNRELALQLGVKRNMQRLFVTVKQLSGIADEKFYAAFMLVLRHVVEDEATIRDIIRNDIKELFVRHTPGQMDTTAFTRSLHHDILRAPDIFISVTNELLMLPRFDRTQNAQVLMLKENAAGENLSEPAALSKEPEAEGPTAGDNKNQSTSKDQDSGDKQKISPDAKAPIFDHPDTVTQFLLSELLAYKDVEDKDPNFQALSKDFSEATQSTKQDAETSIGDSRVHEPSDSTIASDSRRKAFKAEDHPIYVYRCFILQCLTELLQSYNRSKLTFINYSRKAEPIAMTPSKPRSGVLSYLLNCLIPIGSIQHPSTDESRQKANTSAWATHIIISLCSCTPEKGSIKARDSNSVDAEPELVFVRKFILEQALKAFKDTNSTAEPSEMTYSRFLGLADLFNRLLAGKSSPEHARYGRSDHHDNLVPSQKQIAKIMFEKNYIASLTSSVSEIDLNFPGASRVVKYVLRPLKLLTHTAIELSMSADASTSPGQSDGDEISSATSVSDHGEGREETPDLFRNSTLGMFEPGHDNRSSSESEEQDEDEDMYGEDYADDMEYDEEGIHHAGDVVSDEDEEMDGVGPMEGLSDEVGMDLEVDIDADGPSEGLSDDSDDDQDEESESEHEDHLEAMEEVTGDDENHSFDEPGPEDEAEWEDEEASYEDDAMPPEDLDIPEGPLESANESQSDGATPTFDDGNPAEFLGGDIAIETEGDHDVPGEDESEDENGEDDDDDYEEEEMTFEGPDYDDLEEETDVPPFVWGWPPPRRRHSHHHRHQWAPMLHPQDRLVMPNFGRSTRPNGASRPTDDGSNPLLNRGPHRGPAESPQSAAQRAAMRRMQLDLEIGMPGGAQMPPELTRNLAMAGDPNENFPGIPPSAVTSLLNLIGQGPPLHIGLHHHHGGLAFSMPRPLPSGGFHIHTSEGPLGHGSHRIQELQVGRDDPSAAVAFQPTTTERRWQEDARMLFGPSANEKSQRIINSILRLLVPPALEAEKRRKIEEEERKRRMEEQRAQENAEREAKEKQEQEDREAEESRSAAEKAQAEVEAEAEREHATGEQANEDVSSAANENTGQHVDGVDAMEGVEQTQCPPDTTESETAAQPSEPAQRVMTNIRGRELDITDLGIDITYLEALPEEIREEVIMQQYAEQRSNAATAGEESSAINTEFLNALPADIRAELLQQEAQDRRRRERDEARRRAQESGAPAQPEEMDPASFIASLDPTLRQQVLADSDEDMLAALPTDIAAEARALGGHQRRRAVDAAMLGVSGRGTDPFPRHRGEDNRLQRRPIVQMLDKAGVATLLRLMFINVSGVCRTSLNGIFMNACGNRQTRGEVVNGLLSILQDGSADLNAVERCFNQLTLRAKQNTAPKTLLSTKNKSLATPSSGDASPQMVIGQCLGALIFLTQSIPHIPHFFLTEHEVVGAPKTKTKGKGKFKETKASKYPFVALLSLLDRDLVVNNANNMEQLAGLMASMTQPLSAVLKRDKEKVRVDRTQRDPTAAQTLDNLQAVSTNEEAHHENGQAVDESHPDQAERHQPNADVNAQPTSADTSATRQAESSAQAESRNEEGPDIDRSGQKKDDARKPRALEAPEVPAESLRPIINILNARECSSKAFRDTLSTITNLCAIQGAKDLFIEELIQQARRLGQRVQITLDHLTSSLKGVENEIQAQGIALTNFSPNDSDQIKLNRVLTALDYLFESNSMSLDSTKESSSGEQQSEALTTFYEDHSFMELWHRLGACLTATKQSENKYFFNVTTILLPLIEALMVVCKRVPLKDPQGSRSLRPELASPQAPPSGMRGVFFTFTNRHRKILNDLVRHSPKLMSGSFSVLVKNSSVLEFDNKRNFFTRRLHHRNGDMRHYPHPSLQLNVRRDQVFLDSYKCLHYKSPEEIKYGRFNIRFHNEEGVDAGGVTREWFQVLARQMFNPDYALFNPVASDRTTFHPNNLSSINQEHLEFFKFIGRIIGKALYENRVLDCHFSRAVYKRILGQSVSMKDMETVDLDYSKNMDWMLNNDITEIITESFSIAQDNFGVMETVDLVENGRNIPVTEENKHEYVRLVIEYRLTGSVQKQLESFLKGKICRHAFIMKIQANKFKRFSRHCASGTDLNIRRGGT